MGNNRCPNCGEVIMNRKISFLHLFTRLSKRCKYCKNKFRLHYPKIILTSLPLGIYYIFRNIFIFFSEYKALDIIMIILSLCIATYIASKVPLEKYRLGDFFTSYDVNYEIKCKIIWNSENRFCKRIDFLSGYIFPVCFYDKNKDPISQIWCIAFKKVWHHKNYTTTVIEFVRNDAPKELLKLGNQFSIFNDRQKIADGTIIFEEFYN